MRLALSLVRARRDLALKVPPSVQSLEFFNVAREQHASNPHFSQFFWYLSAI